METTPEGDRKLHIETKLDAGQTIRVKVKDSGIGILDDDKIFKPLLQRKKRNGHGTFNLSLHH